MKKTIIISCIVLAIFSFLALTFSNKNKRVSGTLETASIEISTKAEETKKQNSPDFIYDIGTRFSPIKKGDITNATSINSIFSQDELHKMEFVKSVEFIIVKNDKRTDKSGTGNSASFTDEQINFLKSLDYSTNFVMEVDYHVKGDLIERTSTPHYTIVPDTQAQYIYGKDALIKYFIENTKEETANIPEDKLQPAKLYFTVSKNGTVSNATLDRSSGYPNIDELMTELITRTPGGWIPALNLKGETVDQELVVSFGLMGC